jgi:hypothetical protein
MPLRRDEPRQVSELSHKLGTAEGSNRSLDEESLRLRSVNQQLSLAKHELEMQLSEARAKLLALEEKVTAGPYDGELSSHTVSTLRRG